MYHSDNSENLSICAKLIAVYSILLIIVGTFGNFFGFLVCFKRNLRQTPTFVFAAFSFISDIMCLYFWNLSHLLFAFFNFQLEDMNLYVCHYGTLTQCFTLQYSAWLLVKKNSFGMFIVTQCFPFS